ncbi:rhodanese-like domain-containing protein [Rothia kristinae]|uniref:Rhodanese-like domain-containing protein n=1 Tax=Rothia kristinae TaxID=37923 RepID=A0A7T4T3V6_9MICC|nr:rhodanese-like domain-containing protein [Rothia kristinae]
MRCEPYLALQTTPGGGPAQVPSRAGRAPGRLGGGIRASRAAKERTVDIPSVSVEEIPEDAKILDVREDYEWEEGHIERAQHLPLADIPARYGEIPLDEDVYVICRSGGRSLKATEYLNQNGFDAINVKGGMGAWQDAEYPMVSENGQTPQVR